MGGEFAFIGVLSGYFLLHHDHDIGNDFIGIVDDFAPTKDQIPFIKIVFLETPCNTLDFLNHYHVSGIEMIFLG